MSVAALMAAMLAVTAVPAFATIHNLANAECADAEGSNVANLQDPPGITPNDVEGNDPDLGPESQPVVAVQTEGVDIPGPSPLLGTNPSGGTSAENAFDDDAFGCPAPTK